MGINQKQYRELEKISKGFANHRRIQILELLQKYPDLSVFEVSERLETNFKTISEHIRRLALAELVEKRNRGAAVCHRVSDRGAFILKFLRTLE